MDLLSPCSPRRTHGCAHIQAHLARIEVHLALELSELADLMVRGAKSCSENDVPQPASTLRTPSMSTSTRNVAVMEVPRGQLESSTRFIQFLSE